MEDSSVLVVNGDPELLADLVSMIVAPAVGWRVLPAASSADALRLIANGDFAIAIVDLLLSDDGRISDGLRVIKGLRERQPECRIIATVLSGSECFGVPALYAGAHDYVFAGVSYVDWRQFLRRRVELWDGVTSQSPATA